MPPVRQTGAYQYMVAFLFLPVITAVNEMKNKSAHDNGSDIG